MGGKDNHAKLRNEDDNKNDLRIVGDPTTLCGSGPCRPTWVQFFANPKIFTAHATAIIAVLICSTAYFGGVLTTIERQFQLSSSESGTITIINDVVSLSLVLFASYFGHGSHRPRWIATGAVLVGIGLFLLSMPHFASDPVDSSTLLYGKTFQEASVCSSEGKHTTGVQYQRTARSVESNNSYQLVSMSNFTSDECETRSDGLGPIWWIVLGNIIVGVGAAPMYPLITTYIDDAVGKRRLVSYMAFLFMAFAIGPSCGFLLSSQTTKLYVDFDRVPEVDIPDIEQYDPRWIGAWWLGFAFCGVLMFFLGIPMFFYPRVMVDKSSQDEEEAKPEKEDEEDDIKAAFTGESVFSKKGQNGFIDIIKDLIFTIKRLVTNVTLMSMCLAGSAETAKIGIFASFSVKYFQTQFGLSPGTSGMLVGGAIIPCNIISNLLSAWIVRHFKFTSRQCALLVLIALSISGLSLPILLTVGCENPDTAGITVPYDTFENTRLQNTTLQWNKNRLLSDNPSVEGDQHLTSCNRNCSCSTNIFQPVCGSDGITYISPCLAGCKGKEGPFNVSNDNGGTSSNMTYMDCSCITSSGNSSNTATPGQCPITCASFKLPLFVVLCALSFFVMALTGNPLIFIILRCVDTDDRSVALGVKSLITKVLGFFPSPVYFGAIINSTCIFWQYTCSERGACWIYDIVKYRYAYFGTLLVLRICSLFCYFIMYLSIKPEKPKAKTSTEEKKYPDEDLQLKAKDATV